MSSEKNGPKKPSVPVKAPSDSEEEPSASKSPTLETAPPADQKNNADAQIQAHRKQHQQQKTKLFAAAGIIVAIVAVSIVAYSLITRQPSAPQGTAPTEAAVNMSQAQIAKFREDFKQALTQYEINTQPSIDEIMSGDFEPRQASELALLKEQAVSAYAQGAFAQAKQAIETLEQKSKALISQWQAQIALHVSNGQQAFNNEQIPQAQLALNKALALSSSNVKALQLQNRIYAFGEASKLVAELKIAVYENNWTKQVEVITDIIEIDPARTELEKDLVIAQTQHDQQQLARYLESANNALLASEFSKAEQYLQKAKAIKPNSKGAQAIAAQINQARAQQGLTDTKAAINSAVNADNWERVSALVSSALAKHPNDSKLQAYQEQAQQVLLAKKSLAGFIARPQRLADTGIRQAASNALQSAFAASLLSPSLQQQIAQVANGIDQYNNPVEVQINSDGQTYLTVLGVGHVGEHEQKIISLNPGTYVLQAKRDGYRNKRLEFTVEANTPLSLTLICDERI